jgi:glycosyltransferase involved in cell wall biosynthesis
VFRTAAAIVAVSKAMRTTLIDMGAPESRVHYCPYGVDCKVFYPADAATAPPTVLAVGRFVDKKGPHLTILAFAEVLRRHPHARLRMIGDGPLFGSCIDLVSALHLDHAVTFLGQQAAQAIADEMRRARCFVQHSVQAWNGDSEGTPNTVLEAGASGLAVVSTRHAGIADVVIDGHTGYLVEERDVHGMASAMERLLENAALAGQMGRAARRRIEQSYAIERRLAQLWSIIEAAIAGTPPRGAWHAEPQRPPVLDSTPH